MPAAAKCPLCFRQLTDLDRVRELYGLDVRRFEDPKTNTFRWGNRTCRYIEDPGDYGDYFREKPGNASIQVRESARRCPACGNALTDLVSYGAEEPLSYCAACGLALVEHAAMERYRERAEATRRTPRAVIAQGPFVTNPILRSIVYPYIDEASLFAISFAPILLLVVSREFRDDVVWFLVEGQGIIILAGLAWGMGLSLYHAISKKEKTWRQKQILSSYVVFMYLVMGIYLGYRVYTRFALPAALPAVIPAANMLFSLVALFRGQDPDDRRKDLLDGRSIANENMGPGALALWVIWITALVAGLGAVGIHWSLALSLLMTVVIFKKAIVEALDAAQSKGKDSGE